MEGKDGPNFVSPFDSAWVSSARLVLEIRKLDIIALSPSDNIAMSPLFPSFCHPVGVV